MKRSFLLLVVLLAITIVALFAAPLIRLPIKHYKLQIEHLEALECQRVADYTFSEIKESLFKGSIKWEQLPQKSARLTIPLPDARIFIPRLSSRRVSRSFSMACSGEKRGIHGELFRIYDITITVDNSHSYVYSALIQRVSEAAS